MSIIDGLRALIALLDVRSRAGRDRCTTVGIFILGFASGYLGDTVFSTICTALSNMAFLGTC